MKTPGFTACCLLLIFVAAVAILNAGPSAGLLAFAKTIGIGMADAEQKERERIDAERKAEIDAAIEKERNTESTDRHRTGKPSG